MSLLYQIIQKFVAFCVCVDVQLCIISVSLILWSLEYLIKNHGTVCMIKNYVSALRALSVVYNLDNKLFDHPRVKYNVKSLIINHPLSQKRHGRGSCDIIPHGQVLKAVICMGLSHAYYTFHLIGVRVYIHSDGRASINVLRTFQDALF